jgi:hypothetical protein
MGFLCALAGFAAEFHGAHRRRPSARSWTALHDNNSPTWRRILPRIKAVALSPQNAVRRPSLAAQIVVAAADLADERKNCWNRNPFRTLNAARFAARRASSTPRAAFARPRGLIDS